MAVYSNRGDQAYRAIAFGESAAKAIPQDYRLELMPRDLVELIYSAPYRDAFDRYSPAVKRRSEASCYHWLARRAASIPR